jgi:hypothetical protein
MSRGWQSARTGRDRRAQTGAEEPSTLAQLGEPDLRVVGRVLPQ